MEHQNLSSQSINTVNNSIQKKSENCYFMGNGVKIPLQLASFLDYKISYRYSHVFRRTITCSPRINLKKIVLQTGKLRFISSNRATIRILIKIDYAINSTSTENFKMNQWENLRKLNGCHHRFVLFWTRRNV